MVRLLWERVDVDVGQMNGDGTLMRWTNVRLRANVDASSAIMPIILDRGRDGPTLVDIARGMMLWGSTNRRRGSCEFGSILLVHVARKK